MFFASAKGKPYSAESGDVDSREILPLDYD
jgi:hypothetical protein